MNFFLQLTILQKNQGSDNRYWRNSSCRSPFWSWCDWYKWSEVIPSFFPKMYYLWVSGSGMCSYTEA